MKRLILICVLAAAGCGRWADLDSDAFAMGNATQEQFLADSQVCETKAKDQLSWSIAGIAADNVDRHSIYNRTFAGCMKAKGYEERTSLANFWEAYDL